MAKSIIITVGTSLLKEKKNIVTDTLRNKSKPRETPDSLQQLQADIEKWISEDNKSITDTISLLKKRWNAVQSGSPGMSKFDKLPAELASLARFSKDHSLEKEHDQIHLICSDSHKGWLSGKILEIFLKDNVVCKTHLHTIEGLKAKDEKSFKEIGLRKLIDTIAKLSQRLEEQEHDEVFIIATGGYKAESIYATLMGMLCNRPIYYLHEDFQNNIDLPILPIQVDFDLWRENEALIDVVLSLSKIEAEPYYKSLDERIKRLLDGSGSSYRWTPAGLVLDKAYNETSRWSQFQASGKSLLSHLNDDDLKKKYGDYLSELSEYIWVGDKVPEMLDHALKHHQNLFRFAKMFLVPLLDTDPCFMTSEEIYVLLCVILLHDCGHSLSAFPSVPKRPLLPTEIRNWHHILGYERLNPEYFKPTEKNERASLLAELTSLWKYGPDGGTTGKKLAQEFWEDELETIATIGLYHRRRMPLTEEKKEYKDIPACKKTFTPLACECLYFQGCAFTESVVKIAAIFRIIDSCDLQFSRAGTDQERNLRKEARDDDIEAEKKRTADAHKLMSVVLQRFNLNDIEKEVSAEIKKSGDLYSMKERGESKDKKKEDEIEDEIEKHRKSVDCQIAKISDSDKKTIVHETVNLYREASNRLNFKREQEAHFARTAKVKRVFIDPNPYNGMHRFTVRIRGKKSDKEWLKKLKCNMEDEYEKARTVLSKHKIEIDYELDLI